MKRKSVFCIFIFILALNCMADNTYLNSVQPSMNIEIPNLRDVPEDVNAVQQAQQQITVTGIVTDNGGPLPGVNVMVKGTAIGMTTDVDGRYSINVPDKSAVLVFSYIGYSTNEFTVGERTVINVLMEDDTQVLEEVVVIGYGTQLILNRYQINFLF